MSIQAMTRVLEGRVGDRGRKQTLMAFANYAGADGRDIYPAVATIAHDAECSVKTVQRDVKKLLADGWLRLGDQQKVAHIRGDRRPVVYELAMDEDTRKAWAGVEPGDNLSPRETTDEATPVSPRETDTGRHPRPHGATPVSPEPLVTEVLTPQPPASGGPKPPALKCSKHPAGVVANCRLCGTTPRQLADEYDRRVKEAAHQAKVAQQLAAREAAATRRSERSAATEALLAETRRKLGEAG